MVTVKRRERSGLPTIDHLCPLSRFVAILFSISSASSDVALGGSNHGSSARHRHNPGDTRRVSASTAAFFSLIAKADSRRRRPGGVPLQRRGRQNPRWRRQRAGSVIGVSRERAID